MADILVSENVAYFVIAGQSLAARFAEDSSALAAFEAEFLAHNPQYTAVEFFNAARRGTTILLGAAEFRAEYRGDPEPPTNYWYDEVSGVDGPILNEVAADLAAWGQGRTVLGIIWDHGQTETLFVTPGERAADFTTGTHYVLSRLMELSGTSQVFIQGFGDRDAYYPDHDRGSDLMHQLQQDFPDIHSYATLVTATYDLPLADAIHLSSEGFVTAAIRLARGISTGIVSPEAGDVTVSADGAIFVTIAEGGRGLSLAASSDAFRLYTADGTEVAIASITVDSSAGLVIVTPEMHGLAAQIRYASSLFSFELDAGEVLLSGDLPVQPFNAHLRTISVTISAEGEGYRLTGSGDAERLVGFRTDDILNGLGGDDVLDGREGNDTYIIDDLADRVREVAGAGVDTVFSSVSVQLPNNVENLYLCDAAGLIGRGNGLDNRLVGGTAADVLCGYSGDDALRGNRGDDRLYGYAGADLLVGGSGNDMLRGNEGDDLIDGSGGRDRLYGDAGADTFRFRASDSPGLTRDAADVIRDFSGADGDRMDLSALGGIVFIGEGDFNGVAGELRFRQIGDTTFVEVDMDGNGAADFAIMLVGQIDLTSGDFVL